MATARQWDADRRQRSDTWRLDDRRTLRETKRMDKMHSTSETHWTSCPPGTLQNMASTLVARRRRRQTVRLSVLASLVAVTGVSFWGAYSQPAEYDFGGIVCSEVRRLAADYLGDGLPPELTQKLDVHLAECPNCKPLMDAMRKPPIASRPGPSNAIDSFLVRGDNSLPLMAKDQRLRGGGPDGRYWQ